MVSDECIVGLPTCKSTKTRWGTTAGRFLTNGEVNPNIELSELSETALANLQFNVTKGSSGQCDMTIGRDLATSMGLDTCGSDLTNDDKK